MSAQHTRGPRLSVAGRLFQARMWREYAMAWDGKPTSSGCGREWVESILKVPREECLRRARVNVYLARRLNRAAIGLATREGCDYVTAPGKRCRKCHQIHHATAGGAA